MVNSPSGKVEPPTHTGTAFSDPQRNIDAEFKKLAEAEEQLKIKTQKLEEEYQEKFKKLQESNGIPAPTVLYLPEVKVGDFIGEGSFGKVFIGEWSNMSRKKGRFWPVHVSHDNHDNKKRENKWDIAPFVARVEL